MFLAFVFLEGGSYLSLGFSRNHIERCEPSIAPPKGNYAMGAFYRSIDTCVLGRQTYDLSVSFGMAGRLHREEELRVLAHAVESRHQ